MLELSKIINTFSISEAYMDYLCLQYPHSLCRKCVLKKSNRCTIKERDLFGKCYCLLEIW